MITQDFERTLAIVSEVTEIEKENILSSCRQMEYVEARVLFIKSLSEQGYHYTTIAKRIGRTSQGTKILLDSFEQRSKSGFIFSKLYQVIIKKVKTN